MVKVISMTQRGISLKYFLRQDLVAGSRQTNFSNVEPRAVFGRYEYGPPPS